MECPAGATVLQGGRHWRRWLPLAVLLPLLVAILVADQGFSAAALTPALWTAVAAALALRREDVVRLTEDGMAVTKRRKPERLYRWDDLLEVGWGQLGYGIWGPAVRTVGGTPFESPSPGVPSVIAALHRPTQDTKDILARVCAEHHVPYSENMISDIHKGRRKVRVPGDVERRAWLEARRAEAQ